MVHFKLKIYRYNVKELLEFGIKLEDRKLDFVANGGDNKIHNYFVIEAGGKYNGKDVGAGFKFDQNYNTYNSYSHGQAQDGPASNDWAVYFFGKSRGNKSKDDMFAPLGNPFAPKLKTGFQKEGEKKFWGLDLSGSVKFILGIEYNVKLGINY